MTRCGLLGPRGVRLALMAASSALMIADAGIRHGFDLPHENAVPGGVKIIAWTRPTRPCRMWTSTAIVRW
jgi:hypothetical protein